MRRRKILFRLFLLFLVPILLIFICDSIIELDTRDKTYSNVEEIPHNTVGLVLGTARHLVQGGRNPYYSYRINAAVELFNAKKIDYVLVSGDNGSVYYNEPETIKKDLMEAGIPEEKIFLDFAGFRTLDSVVRAKLVFGLTEVTIISQEFHNERAIYLASKKGLNAIGYNARNVENGAGWKVETREYFARVKVFIDLLFQTEPKFYGEKIEIN